MQDKVGRVALAVPSEQGAAIRLGKHVLWTVSNVASIGRHGRVGKDTDGLRNGHGYFIKAYETVVPAAYGRFKRYSVGLHFGWCGDVRVL